MSIWRGHRYVCMAVMFCAQIDVCVFIAFIKMYGMGLCITFRKIPSLHVVNVREHIHNQNNFTGKVFSRYLSITFQTNIVFLIHIRNFKILRKY